MARVQGVPARICTWELVTGFGQNPTEEELADFFHRDFPDAEQLPKFWKLLSFNSSEGRRHRYLVILAEQGDLPCGRLLRGHRILPRALFLYARADEQMRSCEGNGNFRYAAIVDAVLYVLVFYEGRLCHWSEERGYGGPSGKKLATERLQRMDEFLRRDPLFSGTSSFKYGTLEYIEGRFDDPTGESAVLLQRAAKDPFWKGLHLEPVRKGLRVALSIILLLTVMVAGLLAWKTLEPGRGNIPGPEAPRLTLPATEPVSKEPRSGDVVKNSCPKSADIAPDCPKPPLEIRGIVDGRLFSGLFGGMPVIKKAGDTLDAYRVRSILRDRVVLVCGGRELEVVNGSAP